MLESPTRGISKDSHAKAFSRGFITVNNYFWFPPQLNLSPCFLDYLNFRCQGGEILLNLLTRKVSIEDEETYEDNKETEEKSLVVFDLLKSGEAEDTEGFFYSFCSGQVVSSEDVDHCINCHVCFEHSFWNCARYGCLDFNPRIRISRIRKNAYFLLSPQCFSQAKGLQNRKNEYNVNAPKIFTVQDVGRGGSQSSSASRRTCQGGG